MQPSIPIFRPELPSELSGDSYVHREITGHHFKFVINKLLDLHYSLLVPGDLVRLPQFAAPGGFYESLFRMDLDFGLISDRLRYGIVEGKSPSEIEAGLERFFASVARQFAECLLRAYPAYASSIWPSRAPLLESVLSYFETAFLPQEEILFRALATSLNHSFDGITPFFLVTQGTLFGAFTSEPPLSVINVCRTPSRFLMEAVLHETTHGSEEHNAARPESALAILKRELQNRGKEARFAHAWHCLIFWNSGELIRRYVEPSHLHYGEHIGLYRSSGRTERDLCEIFWNAYLDSKIPMQQALEEIAARL